MEISYFPCIYVRICLSRYQMLQYSGHGNNCNTMACHGTRCNNMLGTAPMVIICLVTETDCFNMAVMVTDSSAKCNTVVQDNIYSTKCNTIVVTILLLWFYTGNGAKCGTMVVTVLHWILILLSVKQGGIKYHFKSLLGMNPGLPDHWRTLYSLGQWTGNTYTVFPISVPIESIKK